MLVTQHKVGNCRVYDLSNRINHRLIQPSLSKISYPYKNLLRVRYEEANRLHYIPQTHNYPEFKVSDTGSEEALYRSILYFSEIHSVPKDTVVWVEAVHINPHQYYEKEWYRDNTTKKAVYCIQKENIDYSKYEIKMNNETFKWDLRPGEMMVFDSENILQNHRIEFKDGTGFKTILVISC